MSMQNCSQDDRENPQTISKSLRPKATQSEIKISSKKEQKPIDVRTRFRVDFPGF